MSWQLLTVLSIVTTSLSVILQRILLHKDKSDPIAYVIAFQGLVAVILSICAIIVGFHMPNLSELWFPILGTVVLFGGGHIIYAHTLKQVEASVFAILFATYSVWVMLMGRMLYGDSISGWGLVGTVLIFTSIALLVERKGRLQFDKGIALALLTAVIFGFATTCWVYVGKYSDALTWTALSFIGPALFVMLLSPKSVPKIKTILHGGILLRMTLLGVFYSIQGLASLLAFKNGNVSVVAPLLQTSIILTTILAVIFLKERRRLAIKTAAAITCFAGVALIVSK